ncbi:MAG: 3-phosphoshikimate 1-carboxyvinyltransferase [Clostridia bacterium]|nr:3-phosphoshikimate 1-carboxyvinyltransferase [Clostridia bacterium]
MNYQVKNIYGKTNNKNITVRVDGSKSITARAMLIAALAEGESTLSGAQFSDDCATFLKCLNALGIKSEVNGTTVKITGCGGKLAVNQAEINVGSAGTAARFLPAFLAFQSGKFKVDSSAQMKNRPVEPLITALTQLGARFTFLEKENSFPFIIEGTTSPSTQITVDISKSSQYLSALLMSAVCAGKPVLVKSIGSHGRDYIDMTLNIMWSFGVNVEENNGAYTVNGKYSARQYDIEPDVSAACYFYAINKILGTSVAVNGVFPHSMQGDINFIKLLKTFNGGTVDMSAFSDQTLTLAAIAPYLAKPTHITGVKHIRGQECDRIKAICANLKAMRVRCEEYDDGVKIYPSKPQPATVKTFGDHRVAMSFALTGLRADGIVIEDAEVCSKTFKNYFTVLDGVCAQLALKD